MHMGSAQLVRSSWAAAVGVELAKGEAERIEAPVPFACC